MPTVLRIGSLRVVIYPNDHRPPHVHVVGAENEAVFILGDGEGGPALRSSRGFTTAELNHIASALAEHLADLRTAWGRIHDHR